MSAYHTISAPLHLFLACFPSQQPPPSMVTPQMVRSQTVMAATPLATLTTLWLCSSRSWRAVLCSAGSRLRCAPLAHHKSSAFARWDTPHITWHSWWRFRSMDRFMICKWNKKEMFAEITLNHLHRNQQDKMLKIPLLKLTFWSPKLQLCCVSAVRLRFCQKAAIRYRNAATHPARGRLVAEDVLESSTTRLRGNQTGQNQHRSQSIMFPSTNLLVQSVSPVNPHAPPLTSYD